MLVLPNISGLMQVHRRVHILPAERHPQPGPEISRKASASSLSQTQHPWASIVSLEQCRTSARSRTLPSAFFPHTRESSVYCLSCCGPPAQCSSGQVTQLPNQPALATSKFQSTCDLLGHRRQLHSPSLSLLLQVLLVTFQQLALLLHELGSECSKCSPGDVEGSPAVVAAGA
jgi:hypothetical protein